MVHASIFASSYIYWYILRIPERCLLFPPLTGTVGFLLNFKPCLCSTPSLAGTQQQQQQPHLHQQERGSAAAAAPTARIRGVQQPILHVFSNISCESVTCVSLSFNLRHPRGFMSPTYRTGTLYIYGRTYWFRFACHSRTQGWLPNPPHSYVHHDRKSYPGPLKQCPLPPPCMHVPACTRLGAIKSASLSGQSSFFPQCTTKSYSPSSQHINTRKLIPYTGWNRQQAAP